LNGPNIKRKPVITSLLRANIQGSKRHLAKAVQEFMGVGILVEVGRSPQWRINLDATKEKLTARHERLPA
jgi:hypothetical protein